MRLAMRAALTFPVLMKEMRSRMRGRRVPVLLLLTTALAALVGLFVLYIAVGLEAAGNDFDLQSSAMMGRTLFIALIVLESLVCTIITPALCGGAIALEREKQTLDFLLLTRLSSWNIVLGKYLSALGMIALVFLCSLPVMAISFMLGGVDPLTFTFGIAQILAAVLLYGAISLCCSAYVPKAAIALAAAYGACLAWSLLPSLLFLSLGWLTENVTGSLPSLFIGIFALPVILAMAITALAAFVLRRFHRPMPRFAKLSCSGILAVVLAILNVFYGEMLMGGVGAALSGVGVGLPSYMMHNPLSMLTLVFARTFGVSGVGPMGGQQYSYLFVLPLLISLLFTWMFLALAARALNRRRTDHRGEKGRGIVHQ
ncbi:MAG TPA: hypothetical protein VGM23_15325 [Armatimonadota bacterium]